MDSGKMASPKSLPKLTDDGINSEAYGNQRIEAKNYKLDVEMFLSVRDHISYGSQASLRKLLLMLIMCDWQSNQTGKSKCCFDQTLTSPLKWLFITYFKAKISNRFDPDCHVTDCVQLHWAVYLNPSQNSATSEEYFFINYKFGF